MLSDQTLLWVMVDFWFINDLPAEIEVKQNLKADVTYFARFWVLTVVLQIHVLCDVSQCRFVCSNLLFRGAACLCL